MRKKQKTSLWTQKVSRQKFEKKTKKIAKLHITFISLQDNEAFKNVKHFYLELQKWNIRGRYLEIFYKCIIQFIANYSAKDLSLIRNGMKITGAHLSLCSKRWNMMRCLMLWNKPFYLLFLYEREDVRFINKNYQKKILFWAYSNSKFL